MLSKKRIDKKLKDYIRTHSDRGYSKNSIKKSLVNHGLDENYVEKLLKRNSKIEFVKRYSLVVSLLFVLFVFSFNLIYTKNPLQKATAYSILEGKFLSSGCCMPTCQQTNANDCYGKFVAEKDCRDLEGCIVGCCIDREGYCLTNYLMGNCITSNATFVKNDCDNIVFCRNITDKSYASRLYSLKNKNQTGFSAIKVSSDYYKSSFSIRYYLYDKSDAVTVSAEIIDGNKTADSIILYDDGSHNDGGDNDYVYGNNWQSSRIDEFDGIKKLDVDVIVKYTDGSEKRARKGQSIIIVNNKCLPVFSDYSSENNRSIIIAADNYQNLTGGFEKFQSDSISFLSLLFSTDKFASNADKINIYRIEQSLSYFNAQTLLTVVSNSCPGYSSKKDLLVVLDNSQDRCIPEGSGIIRMNPQALLYRNISDYEINYTMANLCDFILTPKMLAEQLISFASPPNITIDSIGNLTANSTQANVFFTIMGANYPINYSVFGESGLLANDILSQEGSGLVALNLTNETSLFVIMAEDKNRNRAFAQFEINRTII